MSDVVLGIDIGGTNSAIGIVDEEGNVLNSFSIPTLANTSANDLISRISDSLIKKNILSEFEIIGIGIGAPNANYYNGMVESPPNLPGWGTTNLREIVKNEFSVPVAITNDANAAALGEKLYGAAKDMKNFIEITLGTGLGSGIVINNDLLYGSTGLAGELGHVNAVKNGRRCGCGKFGCLESYVSATGLVKTAIELLENYDDETILNDIPHSELSSKIIYEAATKNDKLALKIFDETARIFGETIADFVAFVSPEAIILFGGLACSGEILITPTQKYFNESVLPVFRNTCKIIPSEMPGNDAAILGAAALMWNDLKTKEIYI